MLRGIEMLSDPTITLDESQDHAVLSPSSGPLYSKCLSCPDFGQSCRGYDLTSFSGIEEVRTYHKVIRKAKNIQLRLIYNLAKNISESTINEYFGAGLKDFKWTTVISIHNALLVLCGNRVSLPPIVHSCPSASSEYRNQLAASGLKIAAADVTIANLQAECDDLRRRIADSDGSYTTQLAKIQTDKASEIEWFKQDLFFWRRLSFRLLTVIAILLVIIAFYVAIDAAHGGWGMIRF